MIYIYCAYLSKSFQDNLFNEKLNLFPLEFQNKLLQYRRWQDAQASMIGRLLLQRGLESYCQYKLKFEEIRYSEYYKPFLKTHIDFNITHSGELVCCAISTKSKIGIDIEKINKSVDVNNFKSQMTKFELDKIKQSNQQIHNFYKYWTQKEAVIKLEGKGLSIPLKSFEVKNGLASIDSRMISTKEIFIECAYVCHIASYDRLISNRIILKKISSIEL